MPGLRLNNFLYFLLEIDLIGFLLQRNGVFGLLLFINFYFLLHTVFLLFGFRVSELHHELVGRRVVALLFARLGHLLGGER